jgi:hypothetical protein
MENPTYSTRSGLSDLVFSKRIFQMPRPCLAA